MKESTQNLYGNAADDHYSTKNCICKKYRLRGISILMFRNSYPEYTIMFRNLQIF